MHYTLDSKKELFMDYTSDTQQVKRVQDKLASMARWTKLVKPAEPIDMYCLENFEAEQNIRLPGDYREIISRTANGGQVPGVQHYIRWMPLLDETPCAQKMSLAVPYPPAENPACLDGQLVAFPDATSLPGQILLMGGEAMGFSLITAGPCAGEVWTVGSFGVRRAPACTFSQWLELVLDDNVEAYLTYCLTGEGGRMGRSRRLSDVIDAAFHWPQGAEPAEECARWLSNNRFVYEGPSPNWGEYLRGQLHLTLGLLPQERNEALTARRCAQKRPDWRWNDKCAAKWNRVGQLARLIRQAEQEAKEAGQEPADARKCLLVPGEKKVFEMAVELVHEKRFEARNMEIRDLSFLRDAVQLKELDLWDNDIEDLSPLAALTNLRELWLRGNLIKDLTPLAGLDKLMALNVYGNQITSLEPLRGLTSLNRLDLRGNPLEPGTLACLRKCKRLGMLNLSDTGLGDISDLEFCRAWSLELYENPDLTGLEVLSTMKRLTSLTIDTQIARRYNLAAIAPQLTEHVSLGGISMYTWPEKYYN